MRYNKIRKMDISNGPGIRISIFTQGCAFHCKNCFNPETWDFNAGEVVAIDDIKKQIEDSKIHSNIMGSDHCPVELDIIL